MNEKYIIKDKIIDEMYSHHGSRLKKLVETSGKKKFEVAAESGIAKATLYTYFELEELEKKKIQPILNVLGVSWDYFTGANKSNEMEELRAQIKELQAEKDKWKDKYIACMEENKAAEASVKKVEILG